MHIFYEIEIAEELPKLLKEDIQDLESYYKGDDWLHYGLALELFEATVKSYCINGTISRETGLKLLEKYQ